MSDNGTNQTKQPSSQDPKNARPDLFKYLSYQGFLRDYMAYLKKTKRGFTTIRFAEKTGVPRTYFSMVLHGRRNLNEQNMKKLLPHLELNEYEQNYFMQLRLLEEAKTQDERIKILERINRSFSFKLKNPREHKVYQYYTRWYNLAIRELAALPGFRLNPQWIQSKLKRKISIREIEQSLRFLIENGFIEMHGSSFTLPTLSLKCDNDVYRVAISEFHRELLGQAAESIHNTPREERDIRSCTLPIAVHQIEKVKAIFTRALSEVQALAATGVAPSNVYHVGFVAFPLTDVDEKKKGA